MTRLLAALALLLSACASETQVRAGAPVSGTVDRPHSVPAAVVDPTGHMLAHPATTTSSVPPTTAASDVRSGNVERPPVVSGTPPCGGWRDLIAVYFGAETDRACRVFIGCESKGNPNAVSHTGDHGLTQINDHWYHPEGHHDPVAQFITANWHRRYDPATNLEMARRIRAAYGWGQWTCR